MASAHGITLRLDGKHQPRCRYCPDVDTPIFDTFEEAEAWLDQHMEPHQLSRSIRPNDHDFPKRKRFRAAVVGEPSESDEASVRAPAYVSQMLRIGPGCPDGPHVHVHEAAVAATAIRALPTTVAVVLPDDESAVEALALLDVEQQQARWQVHYARYGLATPLDQDQAAATRPEAT